jgi:class 3 adenylate cyclase
MPLQSGRSSEERDLKRKLATIMVADIVGFSRLTANDEDWTIRSLGELRKIVDDIIVRHDGRIFNTGGDSVLAEFSSPVQAVRCAVDFQEAARSRNLLQPPEHQLRFRIGINLGDVMIRGSDLLGDGVNVAARLEGLAEPGGICVSGTIWDQIHGKLSLGYVDLGEQSVKNLPKPIRAYHLRVDGSVDEVRRGASSAPEAASVVAKSRRPMILAGVLGAVVLAIISLGAFGSLFWSRQIVSHIAGTLQSPMTLDLRRDIIFGGNTSFEKMTAIKELELAAKQNPSERDEITEMLKRFLRRTGRGEREARALAISALKNITHNNLRSIFKDELEQSDLFHANLEGADLYGVSFKGAILISSNFAKANIGGTNFSQSRLRGVNFHAATMKDAILADSDWWNAFGLVLPQLQSLRRDGLLPCPPGNAPKSFIELINARYAVKYEAYPPGHQTALKDAWSIYSAPGGACDYVRQVTVR